MSTPKRVQIKERCETAPTAFNTDATYDIDSLPDWFKPLRYIFEDNAFVSLKVKIRDVSYTIVPVNTPYYAGDKVRLKDTNYSGEIVSVHHNFEDSNITAYSVMLSQEAIKGGLLPIEVFDEKLLAPDDRKV